MNTFFLFVVRRLRWLIRVPLFPQLFDSLLVVWTCFVRPSRLAAMAALEKALEGHARLAIHRFGGVEFRNEHGQQLGHIHGHGLLDVRLSRAWARKLMVVDRVYPHHIFPDSGWVSFQIETPRDVPFAMALLGVGAGERFGGEKSYEDY